MNYYEILGIEGDTSEVTPEQIKQAYRRMAQKVHPDKPEGSEEAFQKVQKAYEVLMDPQKKLQYDSHGILEEDIDPIEQSMVNLILETMQAHSFRHVDYVEASKVRAMEAKAGLLHQISANKKEIKKYERCKKNLVGSSVFSMRIQSMIDALTSDCDLKEIMIVSIDQVVEKLKNLKWEGNPDDNELSIVDILRQQHRGATIDLNMG